MSLLHTQTQIYYLFEYMSEVKSFKSIKSIQVILPKRILIGWTQINKDKV